MKSAGFVSQDLLSGDDKQRVPATLPQHPNPPVSSGEGPTEGNNSGGLRSTVARRFMRMMRAHDRVRMELLSRSAEH